MREMGKVAKRDYFRGQREVRIRATLCIFLLQQEMDIGKREQKKNGTRSLRDGLRFAFTVRTRDASVFCNM